MLFAVVRIRGRVNVKKEDEDTLKMLRLNRRNHCTLVEPNPSMVGMLKKTEKYLTWGEINEETLTKLLQKRGRLSGNRRLTEEYLKETIGKGFAELAKDLIENKIKLRDIPGVKPIFRLRPAKKGWSSKGIKHPYSLGGEFGYRGADINNLL